ncbi:MAG: sigma-70 family RNA polymerase sigma factor [Aureispira sp.]|nr:sigma-70 family RNA polymerase sigma factor [Aureispira sp.]
MSKDKLIDHLFRHQYGKMVAILTRLFGLEHLEIVEDAVQDTFIKAMLSWRSQLPENPEGWLTQAAKNRAVDLFRKLTAEKKRVPNIMSGPASMTISELFLDTEIEDSQLRMIFTACHPELNPKDQIAFALKTISGFSTKEIAAALLQNIETIKKRLSRARKLIKTKKLSFQIPNANELPERLNRVLEVLYLIFNEGFHSNKKEVLVRKELCGEAIRLCQILLKNNYTRQPSSYALFALMCFQSARLDSKLNELAEIIDLKNQDRNKWHFPLIQLGHNAMHKAVETEEYSSYHFEAAIVSEHLHAPSFEQTNWNKILFWYQKLYELQANPILLLNMAIVKLQLNDFEGTQQLLDSINLKKLEQRTYLYYGTYAEYYAQKGEYNKAVENIDQALELVHNEVEKQYLFKKKALM